MSKITQYTAITSVQSDDLLAVVDVHDTSMAPSGTTKKMTVSQLLGGTGTVSSVFGRTGAVTAVSGDYTAAQVGAVATSAVGAASGVASLDSGVHIPAAQLPAATTSVQGAVIIDGTASDIKPLGAQAAGAVGKPADAGHVHPFQAWQFAPETYGAKGDVVVVSDAAITSGTNTLACATSAPFTSTAVDGGKTVYIVGAGASGADYFGTISSVTDPGHAVLSANAGSTVSGKGCVFHTDDTAAIKSAYSAAHSYALSSPAHRAQIVLSKLYGVSSAPVIGGATLGNAIIPLTVVNGGTTAKIRIEFAGLSGADAAELAHWLQPVPQVSGPGLVCTRLDGTNDATYGPASVIGGPWNGYGGATSVFSNMSVVLSNFRIHVPFNSTYAGADFLGVAEDYESGYACQAMGIAPSGGAWPQLNQAAITNQYTFGLRKGDTNNNARQDISQYSCEGLCYGFMPSEHAAWDSARAIYCIIGCELYAGSGMAHGVRGGHLCSEASAWAVGVYGAAPYNNSVKAVIAQVDMENPGQQLLFDNANLFTGSIGALGNYTPGYNVITVHNGIGARICDLMQVPGPLASPQAQPASGSQWINAYYSDAWITLRVSGGSLTSLTLYGPQGSGAGVAQAGAAGATLYSVLVPAGCAYKPVFTGTLAHDITLKGGS